MKRLIPLAAAGIVVASLVPTQLSHAGTSHLVTHASMGSTVTVLVGAAQTRGAQGAQLSFTPKYIDISVGDTVVFKQVDQLEPHTVTFGSMAALTKMANNFIVPVPQKSGPPLFVLDPQGVAPTPGNTYDGMGIANSGILAPGSDKTWKLTFTAPGTYHYICLIHGTGMAGVVTVHPVQTGVHTYVVQAGDGMAAVNDRTNTTTWDQFYPRHLTVKVGDTVTWIGGFHTITFGPEATLQQLEKNLFVPVPQASGAPKLVFNPKIAFPSGGNTYDGTGFVNSGVLALNTPPGSKAPPSFKLTFTKAGTFSYDCLIHPGMDGTVTVTQ